ncbi:hypothetical protein KAH27_07645 [bacterium]|nr:hypothetical protein [bacterium]
MLINTKQRFLAFFALFLCATFSVSASDAPVYQLQPGVFYTNWLVAGTLPNQPAKTADGKRIVRQGFYNDYLAGLGGESQAVVKVGESIPNSANTTFKQFVSTTPGIDFDSYFGMQNQVVAYAFAFVEAKSNTTMFLHIGSDDGIRVWIDSKLVIDSYAERGFTPDEDWAKIQLTKGRHRILVKADDNFGAWKFAFRFVDKSEHNKIIAATISDELDANLIFPTADWKQVSITLNLNPPVKEFSVKINGLWLSPDRTETQKFTVAPGVKTPIPEKFFEMPYCTLTAEIAGIPDKKSGIFLNVYLSSFETIYSDREGKIKNLFVDLSSTSTTFRLFRKHRGILKYYLNQLALFKNADQINKNIKAHKLLTKLDEAIKILSHKKDYFDSLRGEYTAAYISEADNSCQTFTVDIPKKYVSGVPMPMVVFLHDANQRISDFFKNTNSKIPFFSVQVGARGKSTAYLGLSAIDVIETVNFMTNFYSVDPDRIYLLGSGMGGYGVFRIGAAYPQRFAAAASLGSNSENIPLQNLFNLPVYIAHGESDLVTPVGYSIAAADYMKRRACPVILNVFKNVGYKLKFAIQTAHPVKWLLGNRRVSAPNEIIIENSYSTFNESYWLKIISRDNPRKPAKAVARFINANQLVLYFENIENAVVSLDDKLVDYDSLLGIIINGKYIEHSAPLPKKVYISKKDSTYTISEKQKKQNNTRLYQPGSWQNFYNGEPLMIVKGTTGNDKTINKINQCAAELSKWSFIAREMDFGTIPVKKDSELTAEDIKKYNLILLGTPNQNKFLKKINNKLIAKIDKSAINISGKKVSLKENGLWLCQLNPENQEKLVWIWASENLDFYNSKAEWLKYWTYPAEDPPDLLLINVPGQSYANAHHFTKKWVLDKSGMSKIKNSISNEHQIADLSAKAIIKASGADFAWLSKKDFPKFSNIRNFSVSEIANLIFKDSMLCVCEISGDDIKKLRAIKPGAIYASENNIVTVPAKTYKIAVIPENLRAITETSKSHLTNVKYINVLLRQTLQQKLIK